MVSFTEEVSTVQRKGVGFRAIRAKREVKSYELILITVFKWQDDKLSSPSAREVAAWYDVIAKSYDEVYGCEQERKYRVIMSLLDLQENDVVLDAGCGTGELVRLLSRHCSAAVGLDISRGQITLARAKLRKAHNTLLVIGDFERPPFRRRAFSAVIAVTSLHHSSSVTRAAKKLAELARENVAFTLLKRIATEQLLEEILSLFTAGKVVSEAKDYVIICRPNSRPRETRMPRAAQSAV